MAVDRLRLLHDLYGFHFPLDLAESFSILKRLRPLEPLLALKDPLNIHLVGPFEVLAGRFDGVPTQPLMLLHWRFANDPPEFFTTMVRADDDCHWGYWLKHPRDEEPIEPVKTGQASPDRPGDLRVWQRKFLCMVRVLTEEKQATLDDAALAGLALPQDQATLGALARLREHLRQFAQSSEPWNTPLIGQAFLEQVFQEGRMRPYPKAEKDWETPRDFSVALSQLDASLAEGNRRRTRFLIGRLWKRARFRTMPDLLQRLEGFYRTLGRPILARICELSQEHYGRSWLDVADSAAGP